MTKGFKVQFAPPTKYLEGEQGQICAVTKDDESVDYYVQTSKEGEPQWIHMGLFLGRAFEEFFSKEDFIQECLRLYSHNSNRPMENISKLMSERK